MYREHILLHLSYCSTLSAPFFPMSYLLHPWFLPLSPSPPPSLFPFCFGLVVFLNNCTCCVFMIVTVINITLLFICCWYLNRLNFLSFHCRNLECLHTHSSVITKHAWLVIFWCHLFFYSTLSLLELTATLWAMLKRRDDLVTLCLTWEVNSIFFSL